MTVALTVASWILVLGSVWISKKLLGEVQWIVWFALGVCVLNTIVQLSV